MRAVSCGLLRINSLRNEDEIKMKETMKKIKIDRMVSAVLCALLGIVLFVWSDKTISLICQALAVILMMLGVIQIASYLFHRVENVIHVAVGLIEVLIGLWIFLKPESVVSLIPIVLGVILLIHGFGDLKIAFETQKNGYDGWWSILIMAFISIVCGVLSIAFSFQIVSLGMKMIGIALVYDGVSDLWIITRAVKAEKEAEREAGAIDVEFEEVNEEKE